jgi:hypothetical protein
MKKSRLLGIFFSFAILLVVTSTNAATWTTINGRVLTQTGEPICAMVLANGQHMFSCGGIGNYDLYVPLDSDGLITLQVFAAGFAPFRQILTAGQAIGYNVFMNRDVSGRAFRITHNQFSSSRTGWAVVSGNIDSNGTPICAMILINGQSMFSCNQNLGRYSLEVPLDSSGNVTLQAFVAGFQPHRETFPGPSVKPINQVQTERLIGTWDFFYTILSQWEDIYTLPAPAIASTSSPGEYVLFGYDTFGNWDVAAGYAPDLGVFTLLDMGNTFDQFYTFNFTGSNTVTGCYYQTDGIDFSPCYPLDGYRIALPSSVQSLSVEGQGLHADFSPGEKEALKYEEAQGFYEVAPSAPTSSKSHDPVEVLNLYKKLKNSAQQLR